MTTRRNFLKTGGAAVATGIAFCGCGPLHSTHAQPWPRQKLPVMIGGKRVKTIDVHAHCQFREAGALLRARSSTVARSTRSRPRPSSRSTSASPRWTRKRSTWRCCRSIRSGTAFERDLAGQIVKLQNEKLAELCAAKPHRFAAFASLTLLAPDLAAQELETAVTKQGLKGAAIGGTVDGQAFFEPQFHVGWAKAEELGVPLFIHPTGIPELAKKLAGTVG